LLRQGLLVQKGDRWLIVRRAAANIQDDPTVGNLQDGWLTMAHDLAIQNPRVEVRRELVQACYMEWRGKGAQFLTEPNDHGAEIRCYMRDPDGYLIEVGQSPA